MAPVNQAVTVLPRKSWMVFTGPSMRETKTKGVRWWVMPTHTTGRSLARAASTLSVPPEMPKVSAPVATRFSVRMLGPPGLMVRSMPSAA